MPRPLRFEYPGAIYHVLNRGNYRSWVFEDDGAKRAFEDCLLETCERSGWVLHAHCVMGNHYHLAIETPEPNLSEGMRWLQGTYAARFNRFRKERGHLFQGRFKSIVVEGWERLAWLCHYIHLNPARAGIVPVERLASYGRCSYRWLFDKRSRPGCLSVEAFLEGSGGLADTAAGRRKYAQYLSWLAEDEPRGKAMLFDRMSKGWAHGSREFKLALIEDSKKERALLERGESAGREAVELLWEKELGEAMRALGKTAADARGDAKGADWKIAICAWMRRRRLARNAWLSDRLGMGVDAGISRGVRQLKEGDRPAAAKLLKMLDAKIKY